LSAANKHSFPPSKLTHQRNYGRPRAIYHSAPVPANAAITLISAWTQAASNDQTQPKHNGPTGRVAKDRQTVDRQAADSATDTRPPSTAAAAHAAAADEKSHFPSLRAGNGAQSLRCYQHRSYSEAAYHFSRVISDLGLRANAGPVLTATGLVNGRRQFSTPPPHNPHPFSR